MEKYEKSKVFQFGKIAWNSKRRDNPVEVTVRLTEYGKGPVFSASGTIWNRTRTDILCCGQCLDEVAKYVRDPLFDKIYRLWKECHMNDMHAGTPEQETYLNEHRTWRNDYDKDCKCLKKAGLFEVVVGKKRHKYGHAWLYWPIPAGYLAEIEELLK